MIQTLAGLVLTLIAGYFLGRLDARDRAENLRRVRARRASMQRAARIARRHRCGLVFVDDDALAELHPYQCVPNGGGEA